MCLTRHDILTVPSAERLAKVAAIKESSMQYLDHLSESEEEEEEEEKGPRHSQLMKKTLSLYYTDLQSDPLDTGDVLPDWSMFVHQSDCLSHM